MSSLSRIVLLSAAIVALALLAGGAAAAPARVVDASFHSTTLEGRLHYEVYLPAGYDSSRERYPVVYFLHGLPAVSDSYRSVRFVERALARVGLPAILVVPQGARDGEPDPEYVDRGPGDDWGTAIAEELPRIIDARYRTIASRRGRALIGLSAGGYGAMHLALRHLDRFSVVESWSGYFHPTNPAGTRPLDLGTPASNARADVHRQLQTRHAQLRALPTFIAFYVGRGDRRFYAENEQLHRELSQAGIAHVFRTYPGGHDQRLWQRHATSWLALALTHLARAR